MKARTLWIALLLVVSALALAVWLAVAEQPNAAAIARDVATTEPLVDVAAIPVLPAERVEAAVETAPIETSAPPAAIADAPKSETAAGQIVRIAVVDRDGAPVIGAEVRVSASNRPDPDMRALVGNTDVAGRVEWVRDSPNERYLRAMSVDHMSSGWACLSKLPLDVQGARVLPIDAMAHVVGLVLGANELPLPRAQIDFNVVNAVRLRSLILSSAEEPIGVTTDDHGRFDLYVDPSGSSFATASLGALRGQPQEFVPKSGEECELTLRVGDELSVTGVVVAPDSSLVADALVHVAGDRVAAEDVRYHSQLGDARCDEHGRFKYRLPRPGKYDVFAVGGTWVSSDVAEFEVDAEAPTAELTLRLVPPATIEGRVVRDGGEPVADLNVVAHHEHCANCVSKNLIAPDRIGVLSTKTDSEGHFVLAQARVDTHLYTLTCRPDPERPHATVEVTNIVGGSRDVSIVVSEAALVGAAFEGSVVVEDTGGPLTSFKIELWHCVNGGLWAAERIEAVAATDGHFRIESLHPGDDYAASITDTGDYLPLTVDRWTARVDSRPVALTVLKPRFLDVTVTDEHGTRIAGAAAYVINADARGVMRPKLKPNTTDSDGFVRMSCWPGEFSISASFDGRRSKPVPVLVGDRNAPLTIVVPSK